MDHQVNDKDGHRVDGFEHKDESAQEVARDYYELRGSGRRYAPVLQAFRNFCTKQDVKEASNLIDAQVFIKDRTFSISRVFRLTYQLDEK